MRTLIDPQRRGSSHGEAGDASDADFASTERGTLLHNRERNRRRNLKRERGDNLQRIKRNDIRNATSSCLELEKHVMVGLTVAGVASSVLTTTFAVFHVDTFLRAYHLPLSSYSFGSFLFSMINTANDVAGAWLVDHIATKRKRTDLVAFGGVIFAICFLTPFFRWEGHSKENIEQGLDDPHAFWDLTHFVASLSLYDTMYSFMAILLGSVVTDNHQMSDTERQAFMASGKVANLFASFAVTRIGLALFDTTDLTQFRLYLGVLAIAVAAMFLIGQIMIHGHDIADGMLSLFRRLWSPRLFTPRNSLTANGDEEHSADANRKTTNKKSDRQTNISDDMAIKSLQLRRVLQDFWSHKNFRAWIGMEMLLEAQMTFVSHFLKTFVDELLRESSFLSPALCDWFISLHRPLMQIVTIAIYVPIRHFGYPRIYKTVFVSNIVLSTVVWCFASASSGVWIVVFLVLYPVLTGAIQSAGFHLAMSDMVMELKRDHALAGRYGEPSLAGLFMGANALVCKPMESLLPIVAATILDHRGKTAKTLFALLVLPPLACSILQLASWSYYDLSPKRTARMRDELKDLEVGSNE